MENTYTLTSQQRAELDFRLQDAQERLQNIQNSDKAEGVEGADSDVKRILDDVETCMHIVENLTENKPKADEKDDELEAQ